VENPSEIYGKCTNNAILEKIWTGYRSVTNEVPADYGLEFSNEEKCIRRCFTEQSKNGQKNFFKVELRDHGEK
jgi:hypothetical protein